MDSAYSLSDIASVSNGLGGSNEFIWIFALLILFGGGGFGNWGRNNDFSQYATSASQNEILLGQKFDALGQKVNAIGDGICSSTYALNNSIMGEGRALQMQISDSTAATNATVVAQTQKILDAIAQNKIDTLQAQVNTLSNQLALQNATCGTPKISPYMYNVVPSCCGCNCNV